ncbi:MAG: hypothetical protein R3304_12615, partial [Longimicrobiales bacterium]|nr:hypothetical protein [Longimicrobiales bacterium]
MTDPPPAFPDASTRDRVHALLADAGYREDVIAKHVPGRGFARGRMSREALQRTEELDDRLHALLLLFLFDSPVPEEGARGSLGRAGVEALASSGMVVREDSSLRPTLHLVPFHGVVIASDVRERHEERAADFVLGAFGTARNLAACAFRDPAATVLD